MTWVVRSAVAYAIAFGGLFGTFLVAWAALNDRSRLSPNQRKAVGAIGFVLAAVLWIAHPDISGAPNDGSSLADQWP